MLARYAAFAAFVACLRSPAQLAALRGQAPREVVPVADHHKHVLSETAALLLRGPRSAGGIPDLQSFTAEELVAELDSAGIQKAVVLSVAYWFGRPGRKPAVVDEYGKVRAENDFVAEQVARYPNRLVGFCSFNPLSGYALTELERCAKNRHLRGLKFHFGNSRVNVGDSSHVEQVRRVFRAANARRLPIVAHLWVAEGTYGREQAEIFLSRILTEATDVPVQIAHFAGGGPGYTDSALQVYADAIAAGDKRTRNLYFDVTTVADRQTEARLQKFAMRIRQVGIQRVLFGSDLALPGGNPPAREAWANFRATVPLTDDELRAIARNVAPYMREPPRVRTTRAASRNAPASAPIAA
jgi:predicted TIM-barrel fold metal-dependent hydrolase